MLFVKFSPPVSDTFPLILTWLCLQPMGGGQKKCGHFSTTFDIDWGRGGVLKTIRVLKKLFESHLESIPDCQNAKGL